MKSQIQGDIKPILASAIAGLFIVSALLLSCSRNQQQVHLLLNDSLVVKINHPVPPFCAAMFYHQSHGRSYLYVDDMARHAIRLFDLDARTEITPVPLSDTGITPIPYHFGFVVKHPDSIYLPVLKHQLFCINGSGTVCKQIDFSYLLRDYPALSPATSISRFTKGAVILGDDICFIQQNSRLNYLSRKPSDYRFLLKYHMKSDSFSLSALSLPDDFWEEGKIDMSLFITYNDWQKCFVFGSMYSDKIFVSNDGETITKTIRSRSRAIREFFPYSPANETNSETYYKALITSSYNTGLLWDRWKKVYYRFVWPGLPEKDHPQKDRSELLLNDFPTFTIDILDTGFRTIGSYQLPENRYNWNNYFLTEEGLYLAVNDTSVNNHKSTWVFHRYTAVMKE